MKKSNNLLVILLAGVFAFNVLCLKSLIAAEKDTLTVEYEASMKKFQEKMKSAAQSTKIFDAAKSEHIKEMEILLKKVKSAISSDSQVLLLGKVLSELSKYNDALAKCEVLITKNSPLINEAKFLKARILFKLKKIKEAAALFAEVETKIEKNNDYGEFILKIAYYTEDDMLREEYGRKLLAFIGDKPEFAKYKANVYETLAYKEKEAGNIGKSIEILEKGMVEVKDPFSKKKFSSTLKPLKMINYPAPELQSETWYNSSPLKLADLKGKAVVIDFWATWCSPCRAVIPYLVEFYKEYKDKGLVVIGVTHIQGSYRDDKGNKGKVLADKEKELTQEFLKRWNIIYPVAMAKTAVDFDIYDVLGVPTMILIDKNGDIKDIHLGYESKDILKAKIKKLLDIQ